MNPILTGLSITFLVILTYGMTLYYEKKKLLKCKVIYKLKKGET
jgi:hypothetical protein